MRGALNLFAARKFLPKGNGPARVVSELSAPLGAVLLAVALLGCFGCAGEPGGAQGGGSSTGASFGGLPDEEGSGAEEGSVSQAPVQADYDSRRGERKDAVDSYDALRSALWSGQEEMREEPEIGVTDGSGIAWMWATAACEGEYEANQAAPDTVVADGDLVFIAEKDADEPQFVAVRVLDVSSGIPVQVAAIPAQENCCVVSLYAKGGRLFVLSMAAAQSDASQAPWAASPRTRLLTYSFDDPSSPQLEAVVEQSGAYMAARFDGRYAYVASVFKPAVIPSDADPAWFVPAVNGVLVAPEDICAPAFEDMVDYLVVTAIPLDDPSAVVDRIVLASNYASRYVGSAAIYDLQEQWAPNDWDNYNHPETAVLRRVAYGDGSFSFSSQAVVDGGVSAQSMTECEGNLRAQLYRTIEGSQAFDDALTFAVFDELMNQAGTLEDFGTTNNAIYVGAEENAALYRVYSEGEEQMRAVNLSDPGHMAFSDPLDVSPLQDVRLFGPGRAVGVARAGDYTDDGGYAERTLLSLLDVSDPSDVRETGSVVLDATIVEMTSLYDPLMYFDVERGIILFSSWSQADGEYWFYGLRVAEDGSLSVESKQLDMGELNNSFHAVWTGSTEGQAESLWVVVNGAIARCDPSTLELAEFVK